MAIQHLLDEISRHHFPNPPASPEEIDAFEERVGWRLDPDLRAFYLHCNGAELFRLIDTPFEFLPLSRVVRARVAFHRKDDDSNGPPSWYALCSLLDGDYIILDVSTQRDGRYPILDGWHEAFPDPKKCKEIAKSFAEFLEGALRSNGRQFWLKQLSG